MFKPSTRVYPSYPLLFCSVQIPALQSPNLRLIQSGKVTLLLVLFVYPSTVWRTLHNKSPYFLVNCLKVLIRVIIIDQWRRTVVTSECCIKKIICKIYTGLSAGTLANRADPDQTPQNAASDPNLRCLLNLQESKGKMKQSCPRSGPVSQPTVRDNLPTSAVSALIKLAP